MLRKGRDSKTGSMEGWSTPEETSENTTPQLHNIHEQLS